MLLGCLTKDEAKLIAQLQKDMKDAGLLYNLLESVCQEISRFQTFRGTNHEMFMNCSIVVPKAVADILADASRWKYDVTTEPATQPPQKVGYPPGTVWVRITKISWA